MRHASGRVRLLLVGTVGLVALLALGLHQAGFGWGLRADDSAARAALTALLAQEPPPAAAAEPAPKGRDATVEEAAVLDKTITSFLDALRKHEYASAWELLTNPPEGLQQEDWSAAFEETEDLDFDHEGPGVVSLMSGRKARLVDVKTRADGGVALVSVLYRAPLFLSLVQRAGAWKIDAAGSDSLQARDCLDRQLEDLGRGTTGSIFRQMMALEGEGGLRSYLDLLVICPQTASHEIAARTVTEAGATVRLQTRAELFLLVGLKRGPEGWAFAFGGPVRVVPADHKLAAEDLEESGAPLSGDPQRTACLSNLKQLGLAMAMYCQDYDGRCAPADRWGAVLRPYTRDEALLKCPAADRFGYAMNYKLSRGYAERMTEPDTTIALFDSGLLQESAYDREALPGASLPQPPRHNGYNNFGFVDGHVRSLRLLPPLDYYRPYRQGEALPPLSDGPPAAPAGPGSVPSEE